jgi:transposase
VTFPEGAGITSCQVGFLPIVREYARRMELVETIDELLKCRMRIQPGKVVLSMIMDILCGRTPLYRVHESFESRDIEGLLGEEITSSMLTDDTIGRTLDRLYHYGTQKIFSHICLNAYKNFEVDCSILHHDTTSVSVHGDYLPRSDDPIEITYGHSKDKRPDLKQFVMSLLCVEGNLPLAVSLHDGNASDKTINTDLLSRISQVMAHHGVKEQELIFVADSAMVTEKSLHTVGENVLFISRLPETYKECLKVKSEAVRERTWEKVGSFVKVPEGSKKQPAQYRVTEKQVELYGTQYRAVVVHSDAHDRRRKKKVTQEIDKDHKEVAHRIKALSKKEFFCFPDAQKAKEELRDGKYHTILSSIVEKPIYEKGRPQKNEPRKIKQTRYLIHTQIEQKVSAITTMEEEAGCFVLLTTIPTIRISAPEILRVYKEQNFIEQNFVFLKDPLVVNDLFLKLPHRVEALGLICILALLLWRLMERTMRKHVSENNTFLKGWNNRPTNRPTSYMMFSKFGSVQVWIINGKRYLPDQFTPVQGSFLDALDVAPSVFTDAMSI